MLKEENPPLWFNRFSCLNEIRTFLFLFLKNNFFPKFKAKLSHPGKNVNLEPKYITFVGQPSTTAATRSKGCGFEFRGRYAAQWVVRRPKKRNYS